MAYLHPILAAGRWHELSLVEQMGNIGGEVSRALRWRGSDETSFQGAVDRALELFNLTLEDPRLQKTGRLREVARAQEVFCDAVSGGTEYRSSLESLDRYFLDFAMAARLHAEQNTGRPTGEVRDVG